MNYPHTFHFRLRPQKGQTMTEYALILGAIALVVYLSFRDILGDELSEFMVKVGDLFS